MVGELIHHGSCSIYKHQVDWLFILSEVVQQSYRTFVDEDATERKSDAGSKVFNSLAKRTRWQRIHAELYQVTSYERQQLYTSICNYE